MPIPKDTYVQNPMLSSHLRIQPVLAEPSSAVFQCCLSSHIRGLARNNAAPPVFIQRSLITHDRLWLSYPTRFQYSRSRGKGNGRIARGYDSSPQDKTASSGTHVRSCGVENDGRAVEDKLVEENTVVKVMSVELKQFCGVTSSTSSGSANVISTHLTKSALLVSHSPGILR